MLKIRSKLDKEMSVINNDWMNSHFRVNIISIVLVIITEIIVFFMFRKMGTINSVRRYLMLYLVYPSIVNCISTLVQAVLYKSPKVPDFIKPYVLTFGLTICCFCVAVVHQYYSSLAFIMVIPVVVSVIYGNKRLTSVMTIVCMILELVNVFFLQYDSDKIMPLTSIDALIPYIVSFVAQACLIIACYKILHLEEKRLLLTIAQENEQKMLREEARTDKLTGLYNRSALAVCFNEIIEESNSDKSNSYIIAMADMDYFKQVNDTFGHTVGDVNLALIGEIILWHCNGGLAFRYGGDEFCMLYKNTPFSVVKKDCEDIQEEFKSKLNEDTKQLGVSLSFGIAGGTTGTAPGKILREADEQLYIAKQNRGTIQIKY